MSEWRCATICLLTGKLDEVVMVEENNNGLISALLLDGEGSAENINWDGVHKYWDEDAFLWVHLDYTSEQSQEWLFESSGLDRTACNALIAKETRPRCAIFGDGLLICLRGVNLNPGSEPEDMIALRFWIEHHRLVTLRQRRIMAVSDVQAELKKNKGPTNAVKILLSIIENLVMRAGKVISDLDENIDLLEEEILTNSANDLRVRIASTRKRAIGIRRFLAPQKDAMINLTKAKVSWIGDDDRMHLREFTDSVTRFVEDLDSIRERAAVLQEELSSRLAEQTNNIMYALSIITGIFLPLGLLTGLMGINVGGMPGIENPWAFWIVCGILGVITIVEIIFLYRKKWL